MERKKREIESLDPKTPCYYILLDKLKYDLEMLEEEKARQEKKDKIQKEQWKNRDGYPVNVAETANTEIKSTEEGTPEFKNELGKETRKPERDSRPQEEANLLEDECFNFLSASDDDSDTGSWNQEPSIYIGQTYSCQTEHKIEAGTYTPAPKMINSSTIIPNIDGQIDDTSIEKDITIGSLEGNISNKLYFTPENTNLIKQKETPEEGIHIFPTVTIWNNPMDMQGQTTSPESENEKDATPATTKGNKNPPMRATKEYLEKRKIAQERAAKEGRKFILNEPMDAQDDANSSVSEDINDKIPITKKGKENKKKKELPEKTEPPPIILDGKPLLKEKAILERNKLCKRNVNTKYTQQNTHIQTECDE
ncbi:hypothetical protein JTB14_024007 [Gonioctena quinquepunctata]|nr:hypothetical protein JTB14_024007 [Gonioctena quinquepunctata]